MITDRPSNAPTSRRYTARATIVGLTLALTLATATAAMADTAAVRCVQKELNALGFEAGPTDGKVGVRTFLASEAYIRYMKANAEVGWAKPSLNDDNARHWCEKVAEAHPAVAPFWRELKASQIEPSDVEAIFRFAYQFDVGQGVQANAKLAAKWYLKAAEMGHASAQRNLAGLYGSGRGVARNDAEAKRWFLAAAVQGDAQAQYVLGVNYSSTDVASLDWLWKAARQGHKQAISELEKRLDI
jgi:TPR repeat protein